MSTGPLPRLTAIAVLACCSYAAPANAGAESARGPHPTQPSPAEASLPSPIAVGPAEAPRPRSASGAHRPTPAALPAEPSEPVSARDASTVSASPVEGPQSHYEGSLPASWPRGGAHGLVALTAALTLAAVAALGLALRLSVGWPRFPPLYRGQRRSSD
ncbi:hypothetical protein [Salinactinospora qingdaonensis]|uniref:Uncharacterized protein n=1 Tax=Salinactinospora qingdaonensis TaxID=702744 RepID=A0ABP7F4E6_9ACTN